MAVARSVLIRDGYDSFVLRDIAEHSGMKLGNLQYYFATREELLEEIARAENQRALEIIRESDRHEATPAEKIKRLVHDVVGQWHREGGRIFAVVTLLAMHKPRFRHLYVENYNLFYTAIGDVLVALEPESSRDTILRKARLATSLLDGALLQIPLEQDRESKKARAEFLAELADAMLRLLGHEA